MLVSFPFSFLSDVREGQGDSSLHHCCRKWSEAALQAPFPGVTCTQWKLLPLVATVIQLSRFTEKVLMLNMSNSSCHSASTWANTTTTTTTTPICLKWISRAQILVIVLGPTQKRTPTNTRKKIQQWKYLMDFKATTTKMHEQEVSNYL